METLENGNEQHEFLFISTFSVLLIIKKMTSPDKEQTADVKEATCIAGSTSRYHYKHDFDSWLTTNEQAGIFMKDVFEDLNYGDDWNYQFYETIKQFLSLFILQEVEDQINDDYAKLVHEFFLQRNDVFKEVNQEEIGEITVNRTPTTPSLAPSSVPQEISVFGKRRSSLSTSQIKKHRRLQEKGIIKSDVYLKKLDRYGLLTVNLIDARMHEEIKDCASNRTYLIYLNIFQLMVSFVIFILGADELQGGQFPPLLASFVAAIVGVVSSLYGLFGAIGENETFIVSFMVANFWLMAILTTFLYTEIYMLKNTEYQCFPSRAEYGDNGDENCSALYGSYGALMALALVQFVVVVCDHLFYFP